MGCGDGQQAFHPPVRVKIGNQIPGVQSAHAVRKQGKGGHSAAEKRTGKYFCTLRYRPIGWHFRRKCVNMYRAQRVSDTPKIFERSPSYETEKTVQ
jgi:hypothetical protein